MHRHSIDDHDGFDGIYWAAGPRNVPTTTPPAAMDWRDTVSKCLRSQTIRTSNIMPVALTRTAAVIGKARTALANGSGIDCDKHR